MGSASQAVLAAIGILSIVVDKSNPIGELESHAIMGEHHGAVTVSTGWRTFHRDAGREGVHSRKSRLKKIDANNIVPFARKTAPVAA